MTVTTGEKLARFASNLNDDGDNISHVVATLAALKAEDTTGFTGGERRSRSESVSGDGLKSEYIFRAGDQSAAVAAKVGDNWVVPTDRAADGSTGAWQAVGTEFFDRLAPAYLKTVSDLAEGLPISALRFIDKSKHAGIRARTNTDDLAARIQDGIDVLAAEGGNELVLGSGLYHATPGQIHGKAGVTLVGPGGVKPNDVAGTGAVIRAASTVDDYLIDFDGTAGRLRGIGLRGIALDCANKSRGVRFYKVAEIETSNLLINQALGEGLLFRNAWDGEFRNTFLAQCGSFASSIAAIEIQTDTIDNSNSLHFFALRTEASNYSNLAIRNPEDVGVGSSNNIHFVASKFHLPAAPYAVPDCPNLILRCADDVSFIGGQIYDAGASHSVIDIGDDAFNRRYFYKFSDIQMEARTSTQLIGVGSGVNSNQVIDLRGNTWLKNGNHVGSVNGIGVDAGFQGSVMDFANIDAGIDTRVAGNTGRIVVPMGSNLSYKGAGDFEIRTDTDNRIVFYVNGAQAGYVATDGNLFWDGKLIRADILELTDGVAAPPAGAGGARLYVDAADGDLKIIFADGTIKTIVIDT